MLGTLVLGTLAATPRSATDALNAAVSTDGTLLEVPPPEIQLPPSQTNTAWLPEWITKAIREAEHNATCTAPGSFYIYEFDQCAQNYKGVGKRFLDTFQKHPCRTDDPDDARVVLAAFSMRDAEVKGNDMPPKANGKHLNCLVQELMRLSRQDRWKKRDGADFFFHYEAPMTYVNQPSPITNFIINGDMMDAHYKHAKQLLPFLEKYTIHSRFKAAEVLKNMTVLSVEPPTNVQLSDNNGSCYQLLDKGFRNAYGIPYQVGSEVVSMARADKLAAVNASAERNVIFAGDMGVHGHDTALSDLLLKHYTVGEHQGHGHVLFSTSECPADSCNYSYAFELFSRSKFCAQPFSDTLTRPSIFLSLSAGCIPVFFQDCADNSIIEDMYSMVLPRPMKPVQWGANDWYFLVNRQKAMGDPQYVMRQLMELLATEPETYQHMIENVKTLQNVAYYGNGPEDVPSIILNQLMTRGVDRSWDTVKAEAKKGQDQSEDATTTKEPSDTATAAQEKGQDPTVSSPPPPMPPLTLLENVNEIQVVEIAKTAGGDLAARLKDILPLNVHADDFCLPETNPSAMRVALFRAPYNHVLSLYLGCRDEKPESKTFPRPKDPYEGFKTWLQHFNESASEDLLRLSRREIKPNQADFGCYNPWNMQARVLTCTSWGNTSHLAPGRTHHAKYEELEPDMTAALNHLKILDVVGITEYYQTSLCLAVYHATGQLQDQCTCDAAGAPAQREYDMAMLSNQLEAHVERDVPDAFPTISHMTKADRVVYRAAMVRAIPPPRRYTALPAPPRRPPPPRRPLSSPSTLPIPPQVRFITDVNEVESKEGKQLLCDRALAHHVLESYPVFEKAQADVQLADEQAQADEPAIDEQGADGAVQQQREREAEKAEALARGRGWSLGKEAEAAAARVEEEKAEAVARGHGFSLGKDAEAAAARVETARANRQAAEERAAAAVARAAAAKQAARAKAAEQQAATAKAEDARTRDSERKAASNAASEAVQRAKTQAAGGASTITIDEPVPAASPAATPAASPAATLAEEELRGASASPSPSPSKRASYAAKKSTPAPRLSPAQQQAQAARAVAQNSPSAPDPDPEDPFRAR